MNMRKMVALLMATILCFSTFAVLAEDDVYMIAPTVEMRNGVAYSTVKLEQKDFDYKSVVDTKNTLQAGVGDVVEYVSNGGFEVRDGENYARWGIDGVAKMKADECKETKDVKSEKVSLHLKADGNLHAVQGVDKLVGGTYELSGWCKRLTKEGVCEISMYVYYSDEESRKVEYKTRPSLSFGEEAYGEWTFKTLRFTMPDNVRSVSLLVRLREGGEVLWDDISLLGPGVEEKVDMPDYAPPLPGAENLIVDGGFEADSFMYMKQAEETTGKWFTREDKYAGIYEITDEKAHTGSHSLRLRTPDNWSLPWVGQIVPVESGVVYQLSGYIYFSNGSKNTVSIQADAYKDAPEQTDDTYLKLGQRKGVIPRFKEMDTWHHFVYQFTAYGEADFYAMLLRAGDPPYDVYFDDLEFVAIGEAKTKLLMLEPDCVFYYADRTIPGTSKLTLGLKESPEIVGKNVRFRVLDGETVLDEKIMTIGQSETLNYSYDLDLLAEKKKEYKVQAMLLEEDGSETVHVLERIIYKYDRPTQLDKNMQFVNNGGQVINYILGQGSIPEVMHRIGEVGVTVGRAIGGGATMTLKECLDVAQEEGVMATVTLFNKKDIINDPALQETVKKTIEKVKDHPALFGWYLWEEPEFTGGDIALDENIRFGTKLIRDLDPVHPIGSVISEANHYQRLACYNDYMDLDCYAPINDTGHRYTYFAANMRKALNDTHWEKNMSLMLQAFTWFEYFPTFGEMRNMIYQTFMEGASGFSFHAFTKPYASEEEKAADPEPHTYVESERWYDMEDAAEWEYDFMFDHFVHGKYPMFAEYHGTFPGPGLDQYAGEDCRWRLAVVDDSLYAIVLNNWETKVSHADIPLVSYNGKVSIGDFTVTKLAGDNEDCPAGGNGVFSVDVAPKEAAVFKITPTQKTDFSAVRGSRFRDLYDHAWAREAIIELDEKGIANEKSAIAFGPADNITRGDFAMFLVRTLGLTGDASDNFADVKPGREYAKELAIGKAAGILNGVGDNKFNPEAQITRQDMMTMTSRALALTGGADLSAFSDAASIADYAKVHVAAMVEKGLVKGNADGTINPLGQTTRAEAATIMYRLLNA